MRRLGSIFLALLWLLQPTAALTPGQQAVILSGPSALAWLPTINGAQPTYYADFGSASHYWFSGAQYTSPAAWLTAVTSTFTRATNATYFAGGVIKTAAPNVIRFPTDMNGNGLGIRLTRAQQNLMLHSAFDSGWTAGTGTLNVANIPGPDGNATSASTYIPGVGNTNHNVTQVLSYAASTYTWSVFCKNLGYNFCYLDAANAGSAGTGWAVFDLTTGAVASKGSAATAGTVQLANGWWYCWVTSAITGSSHANDVGALPTSTYGIFAGNGTSAIGVFGASINLGTFPPDYIPTTTVAVSQAVDILFFPYTQTTLTGIVGINSAFPTQAGSLGFTPRNINGRTLFMAATTAVTENTVNGQLGAPIGGSIVDTRKLAVTGSPAGRAVTGQGAVPVSDVNALISGGAPTNLQFGTDQFGDVGTDANLKYVGIWSGLVVPSATLQGLTQ